MHSVLGGAPGYRALADAPQNEAEFPTWVQRTVLDPALALHSRAETEGTASSIGSLLGRERGAMTHQLDVLESTSYVTRSEDMLQPRTPTPTLTDPIVRFSQLITLPFVPLIEDGRAAVAWAAGHPTFHAKILGPHFEEPARFWTGRHARDEADGLEIGPQYSAILPLLLGLKERGCGLSKDTTLLFGLEGWRWLKWPLDSRRG